MIPIDDRPLDKNGSKCLSYFQVTFRSLCAEQCYSTFSMCFYWTHGYSRLAVRMGLLWSSKSLGNLRTWVTLMVGICVGDKFGALKFGTFEKFQGKGSIC
jgi:hypothetical protein